MPDELLPCPFCGGAARIWDDHGYSFVSCTTDPAHALRLGYAEPSDAVAAWNRRAATWPAGDEAAEQLARAWWHVSVETNGGTPWDEAAERVREVRTEQAAAVLDRLNRQEGDADA